MVQISLPRNVLRAGGLMQTLWLHVCTTWVKVWAGIYMLPLERSPPSAVADHDYSKQIIGFLSLLPLAIHPAQQPESALEGSVPESQPGRLVVLRCGLAGVQQHQPELFAHGHYAGRGPPVPPEVHEVLERGAAGRAEEDYQLEGVRAVLGLLQPARRRREAGWRCECGGWPDAGWHYAPGLYLSKVNPKCYMYVFGHNSEAGEYGRVSA